MAEESSRQEENFPKIDGYEIIREIGKGGVAVVYEAIDKKRDRIVAIKIPLEDVRQNQLDNFFDEAKKVSPLGVHNAIVPIYDYDSEYKPPYIVMGWMEGGSLQGKLDNRVEPFSFREALPILERIADAIDYTHQHDLLHRDISPSNIMFDKSGKAYLGDFGCAMLKDVEREPKDITQKPTGNPDYLAPEQVLDDPMEASDRYALALVAYEMLTGRLAVTRWSDVKQAVLQTTTVRGEILRVLTKGFATEPEERYPSATEFVEALKEAIRFEKEEDKKKESEAATGRDDSQDDRQDDSQDESQDDPQDKSPPNPFNRIIFSLLIVILFLVIFLIVKDIILPSLETAATPTETVANSPAETLPTLTLPPEFVCEQTIAYAYKENGNYDIYTFNLATGSHDQITTDLEDDRSPAWSPGGDQLAFQAKRDGFSMIVIYTLQTKQENPLSNMPLGVVESASPSWSPDGTKIVFSAYIDFKPEDEDLGQWDLYLYDLTRKVATNLTNTENTNENDPHWSWVNNKIIYQSEIGGNVYLSLRDMGTSVSKPEPIIFEKENLQPGEPEWSPNGSRIVFSYIRPGGVEDITTAELENDQWNLEPIFVDERYKKKSPTWSPNNMELLFVSDMNDDNENWDIYRHLLLAESAPINLTEGMNGTLSDPAWCMEGN